MLTSISHITFWAHCTASTHSKQINCPHQSESDDKAEVVGCQFEPGFAEEEIISQNDASSPAVKF